MVKVISLSEEAYDKLKMVKNGKSFSETVLGLIDKKNGDILSFFGKWPGPKEELKLIERTISSDRKKTKLKEVEL